jgi:transcriptional regulator GlxA family with amidase domain
MKMAFICFDQMTTLDLTGFSTAVTWLGIAKAIENVSWDFCAAQAEVTDDRGMIIRIPNVLPDLSQYDLIFIPGGMTTRKLRFATDFLEWLQTAKDVTYKVSVCTGALLLGAAGFLEGKKATTNPSAYELLVPYCSEVIRMRVVRDGHIFTAGGVAASIDLGLYMVEFLTNREFTETVQKAMDYPYYQVGKFDITSTT